MKQTFLLPLLAAPRSVRERLPAATTLSAASPTPIASDKKNAAAQRRAKRAEKKARKGQVNPEVSPELDASARPDANEP
jgi:hypothetical protein